MPIMENVKFYCMLKEFFMLTVLELDREQLPSIGYDLINTAIL